MDKDYVTPQERVGRRAPRWLVVTPALIGLILAALGLADAVTRWGERSPVIEFKVTRSCGY